MSAFYEMALVLQFAIAAGYWLTIYPYSTAPQTFFMFKKHVLPLPALLIELILNQILVERRHWVIAICFAACFELQLILQVFINGKVLYIWASLDSTASWIYTISFMLGSIGVTYFFAFLSGLKFDVKSAKIL